MTIRGTAKEKILEVASQLFYTQGYNATGIQQIIDEADVSKGTFYTHFKTKDDLGLAYLQNRHNIEFTGLKKALASCNDPYDKYTKFIDVIRESMIESNFRGCAFANMSAEVTDLKSPIRKEAKFHYEAFRAYIRDFVEELIKSDAKYQKLEVQAVADDYMLIIIGAFTNAEIYQDAWPFDRAAKSVIELIREKR